MKGSQTRQQQLTGSLVPQSEAPEQLCLHFRSRYLTRYSVLSIGFVVGWSLVISWWEWLLADDVVQILALVFSKFLLLGLAFFTLRGSRIATGIFLIVCFTSVFFILSEIRQEYAYSSNFAILSAIECIGKLMVLSSFLRIESFRNFTRTGNSEVRSR